MSTITKKDDFVGNIARMSDEQFSSLLIIFDEYVTSDREKVTGDILNAMDEFSWTPEQRKAKQAPPSFLSVFKDHAMKNGSVSAGCYNEVKKWIVAQEGAGFVFEKPKNKKVAPKQEEEVKSKAKPEPQAKPAPVKEVAAVEPIEAVVVDQPIVIEDEDHVVEEAPSKSEPRSKAKPKQKSATKTKNKKKAKSGSKKKGKNKEEYDILDPHPFNINIFDTNPKTHPELFIAFEHGDKRVEYISKRVIVNQSWKPVHPVQNPIKTELLKEIVSKLMDESLNYEDIAKIIDETKVPFMTLTPKRVWWMLTHHEFIRYCLVTERSTSNTRKLRLIQKWPDNELIKFVNDEREKYNKK